MAAIRSPRMPTSAATGAAPVPSYTVPPRIRTSKRLEDDGVAAGLQPAAARMTPAIVEDDAHRPVVILYCAHDPAADTER